MNVQVRSTDLDEVQAPLAGHAEAASGNKHRGNDRRARASIRIIVALVVLAGLAWLAWPWAVARWTHVVLDDARIAANMVTISSEISGRVAVLPVIVGDHVRKGDLLAEIDSSAVRQELKALEAQIRGVEAKIRQLRAQQDYVRGQLASKLAAARTEVEAAEATHARAGSALDNARSQFERANELAGRNVFSAQQQEDAKARLESARQEERAAAAGIKTAMANIGVIRAEEAQIGVLDQQIAALQAEIGQFEALSARQRIDLDRYQLRAAFDGVIDNTFIDPGEYVSPGTRLLIYHDPQTVWIDANIKETDFRKLEVGAPAVIRVDAYPDREFRGEVIRLGEAATSQFALLPSPNPSGNFTKVTQRLPVRISVAQVDGLLRPGMMVEASINVR